MDKERTVLLAVDPGVTDIAVAVKVKIGDATMSGNKMSEIKDDRDSVVRISNASWHDMANHNAARRHHEWLLRRAKSQGIDIHGFETSIPSSKTSDPTVFLKHATAAVGLFPMLYSHYKQERKCRWKTYRKEQSAMHKLCMRVKGDPGLAKEDVVVAYGAGQFGSTMRGRRSVPVQRFRKELERYVTVVPTNEMRTSRVCSHGCGWKDPVRAMSEEEHEERKKKFDLIPMRGERSVSGRAGPSLHGVRFCHECYTVWNRDVNAARNIAYSFLWQRSHAGELPPRFRPHHRRREDGSGDGRTTVHTEGGGE
jgi:hypothetical protein